VQQSRAESSRGFFVFFFFFVAVVVFIVAVINLSQFALFRAPHPRPLAL